MAIPSPLFNCQRATLLVERRADEVLPRPTRFQLWAHMALCPYCRRYEAQSQLIARQAAAAAETLVPTERQLPLAARTRLQELMEARLNSPSPPKLR